jgi:hypothetical protein
LIAVGRFRISLEGLGLAVLGLALVLSVSRCNAVRDGRDAERLAAREANAYKASMAGIRSRAVTDSVIRTVDSVTRIMTNRIAANRKVEARLLETLAYNDSLLSAYALTDGANDTTRTLMIALQRTTEVARLYRDSTEMLLNSVDVMVQASVREREAWLAERAKAAEAIALERQVSEHLRKQARCRVLGVPCPTRVQSAMVGAVGVLLLLAIP